jgi:hypothetical protein
VNPVDYLAATLRAILDGHPQSGIEDLMPWRFNQPSSLAALGKGVALTDECAKYGWVRSEMAGGGRRRAYVPHCSIYAVNQRAKVTHLG